MKIVVGTNHYPPRFVGGIELITQRMARWLVAHGHQVEVICVESIEGRQPLSVTVTVEEGITVHRLTLALARIGEHLGLRYRDATLERWFASFFADTRPDLFHSQSSYLITASTLRAAKAAGIPTIITLHDFWYFCPRLTLLRSDGQLCQGIATPADCTWCVMMERRRYRLLDTIARRLGQARQAGSHARGPLGLPLDEGLLGQLSDRQQFLEATLRSADLIVTIAPQARDRLLQQGLPAASVRLIRSGLEPKAPMPRSPRAPGAPLRIGYLGQIAPHKGVHLLVAAFQRLRPAAAPPELWIHGDASRFPAYHRHLQRLAGENTRIHFCRPYANQQVNQVLSTIDVLVVPSLCFEMHPLVILEALAAGVPVVTSRLPNMAFQITDEVNGLLYEPGSVVDLARCLQRLLDEPELLARLAAGITPVRQHDEEMREIEALYQAVVARAKGPVADNVPLRAAHREG